MVKKSVTLALQDFRQASVLAGDAEAEFFRWSGARRDALRRMREAGLSYKEIGELVGLHKSRVHQLLKDL